MAFITTRIAAHESWGGTGYFEKDGPAPKTRVLFDYCIPPIYWVVREDSGVNSISDLSGKPYAAGIAGASSTLSVFEVFDALGMDDSKLETGTTADLVNAVIDNRLIGVTKASGMVQLDSSLLTIQAATPIKVLSFTEAEMKKFQEHETQKRWIRYDLPTDTLKALLGHGPIVTLTFITGCMSTSELPQEAGYEILKTAVDNWEEWGSLFASSLAYDVLKDQLKEWPAPPHIPLHAGTVQFLKEKGVDVADEFIPPEYKP
jgi:TRAP transporter TAXI family solute receptor